MKRRHSLALAEQSRNFDHDAIEFKLVLLDQIQRFPISNELVALGSVVKRSLGGLGIALSGAQLRHPEVAGSATGLEGEDLPAQGTGLAGELVPLRNDRDPWIRSYFATCGGFHRLHTRLRKSMESGLE